MLRSLTALLLLATYLLLAGMGCITAPNSEQNDLLMVQTHYEGQRYEDTRYLRMDGLEAFMAESLATRYQDAPTTPPQHILTVVQSIDMHCLPKTMQWLPVPTFKTQVRLSFNYAEQLLRGISASISSPPWRE